MVQCLRLDQTSNVDPLTLLEKISKIGISQDVCINDLGKLLAVYHSFFHFRFDLIFLNANCT